MATPDSWPSELIARLTSTDPDEPSTVAWPDEFDYFVLDQDGYTALFCTAGTGPIPRRDEAWLWNSVAALEMSEQLPEVGQAVTCHGTRDGDFSEFYALSARGPFVYDWHAYRGPFQLISRPTVPRSVSDLPSAIRDVAVPLLAVGFSGATEVGSAELALPGFADEVRRRWGSTHVY